VWVRARLLPAAIDGGWTREALTEALDRLTHEGYQPAKQEIKIRGYLKLPNIHAQPRTNDLRVTKYHYYRRGMRGALTGEPGCPDFMAGLIEKERQFASRQAESEAPAQLIAKQADANPFEALPEQSHNRSPTTAQPSPQTTPIAPKFVTENVVHRGAESRAGGVLKISRRRAEITQAEIARVIRAAKQAGAAEVEVRLSDSASVVVRLQPDNPLASDEEIVL
jgi:hypothetical protein